MLTPSTEVNSWLLQTNLENIVLYDFNFNLNLLFKWTIILKIIQ